MKRVYKLTPVSLYDIRGTESWLEDMALRGLTLVRLRPLYSTFQEGPARKTRYRAEPFRRTMADDGPPQAMLDLYQDFGWELAGEIQDILIFSTLDPNAPEPHSDPEIQSEVWRRLYRYKRRDFWVSFLLDLVVGVCSPLILFRGGTPVLNLLTTSVLWTLIVFFILTACIPANWADVQRLALIVQQLEAGIPLDHRSAYPRRRWNLVVTTPLFIILFVLLIASQWILPFTGGDVRPLDELTAFPMLSLTEVEGDSYVPHSYVASGLDYANFCAVDHYLLCPDQWRVVQSGDIQPDNWVRMEIQWYDLPGWLSPLSAPLARELLNRTMGPDQNIWWTDNSGKVWTVDYYPFEGTSFLAIAHRSDGQFHVAAAANRDKAVLVRYTGVGDLGDYLEEIAKMIN